MGINQKMILNAIKSHPLPFVLFAAAIIIYTMNKTRLFSEAFVVANVQGFLLEWQISTDKRIYILIVIDNDYSKVTITGFPGYFEAYNFWNDQPRYLGLNMPNAMKVSDSNAEQTVKGIAFSTKIVDKPLQVNGPTEVIDYVMKTAKYISGDKQITTGNTATGSFKQNQISTNLQTLQQVATPVPTTYNTTGTAATTTGTTGTTASGSGSTTTQTSAGQTTTGTTTTQSSGSNTSQTQTSSGSMMFVSKADMNMIKNANVAISEVLGRYVS